MLINDQIERKVLKSKLLFIISKSALLQQCYSISNFCIENREAFGRVTDKEWPITGQE